MSLNARCPFCGQENRVEKTGEDRRDCIACKRPILIFAWVQSEIDYDSISRKHQQKEQPNDSQH